MGNEVAQLKLEKLNDTRLYQYLEQNNTVTTLYVHAISLSFV